MRWLVWLVLPWIAVACATAPLSSPAPAPVPPAAPVVEPRASAPVAARIPGGVGDDQGEFFFVEGERGGVEAIGARDGKLRWRNDRYARPIAFHHGSLVALEPDASVRGRARIVRVAPRDGRRISGSAPLAFPLWAPLGGDARARARARLDVQSRLGGETLVLRWQALDPRGPQSGRKGPKTANGAFVVDLASGKVTALAYRKAVAPSPPVPREIHPRPTGQRIIQLQQNGRGVQGSQAVPFAIGDRFAVLILDAAMQGDDRLYLSSWNAAGKDLRGKELASGNQFTPIVSLDGRHLILYFTRRGNVPQLVTYSLEGDAGPIPASHQLRSLAEASPLGFAIHGDRLYVVRDLPRAGKAGEKIVDRRLAAFSVADAAKVWEYPLLGRVELPPKPFVFPSDGSPPKPIDGRCPYGYCVLGHRCVIPGGHLPRDGQVGQAGVCGGDGGRCSFCKCAAATTPVRLADGREAPIASLAPGDSVVSLEHGARVAVPIKRIARCPVFRHTMVRVALASGRNLEMSGSHPLADGRRVGELRAGDTISGTRVVSVERVAYPEAFTYDILPDSPSGTYLAADVEVASTIGARCEGDTP